MSKILLKTFPKLPKASKSDKHLLETLKVIENARGFLITIVGTLDNEEFSGIIFGILFE